jgi:hypothetical protein
MQILEKRIDPSKQSILFKKIFFIFKSTRAFFNASMSNPANKDESFVDTMNWDFKATTIIDFAEELDRTSATDFFNRESFWRIIQHRFPGTNGLGSPEFYAERKLQDQMKNVNEKPRHRMVTRNQK